MDLWEKEVEKLTRFVSDRLRFSELEHKLVTIGSRVVIPLYYHPLQLLNYTLLGLNNTPGLLNRLMVCKISSVYGFLFMISTASTAGKED